MDMKLTPMRMNYRCAYEYPNILLNFRPGVKDVQRNFEKVFVKMIFPLYRITSFGYNVNNYVNFTK